MPTISMSQGHPESGVYRTAFVLSEGSFAAEDVAAINAPRRQPGDPQRLRAASPTRGAQTGPAIFSSRKRNTIAIVRREGWHIGIEHRALQILRRHYPDARITTRSRDIKNRFGDLVELV